MGQRYREMSRAEKRGARGARRGGASYGPEETQPRPRSLQQREPGEPESPEVKLAWGYCEHHGVDDDCGRQ